MRRPVDEQSWGLLLVSVEHDKGSCNRPTWPHASSVVCGRAGAISRERIVRYYRQDLDDGRGWIIWPCLRSIAVHTDAGWSAVVWEGRVISGSKDATISVCGIVTAQLEATLEAQLMRWSFVAGRCSAQAVMDPHRVGAWYLDDQRAGPRACARCCVLRLPGRKRA